MTPREGRIDRPPFTRKLVAFLIGVPLAWAVLLWFHPDVDPDDVYGSLADDANVYVAVHVGTLIFIALMGVALYLLIRDLPGRAATISRWAIGPFVLFYSAWEAVIGLAVGVLAQHANDAPADERPAVSDAMQALGESGIVGEAGVLLIVGALAWATAAIAAAVAIRSAGAPMLATVLLGLSVLMVAHPPPTGPVALACFAGAVLVLYRKQLAVASRTTRPEAPEMPPSRRAEPQIVIR